MNKEQGNLKTKTSSLENHLLDDDWKGRGTIIRVYYTESTPVKGTKYTEMVYNGISRKHHTITGYRDCKDNISTTDQQLHSL